MDEILQPNKPLVSDDSPVSTNKYWFLMVSTWCRISSIHSIKEFPLSGRKEDTGEFQTREEPPAEAGEMFNVHFEWV